MKYAYSISIIISTIPAIALDFATDCRCARLRTIICEGQSFAAYQYAWHTIKNSSSLTLQEKAIIQREALLLAQQSFACYTQSLQALSCTQHSIMFTAQAAFWSYLLMSAIAFKKYHITLVHRKASYFFLFTKLLQRARKFDTLGALIAYLQVFAGTYIAPCGILYSLYTLYQGPEALRTLRTKTNNLTEIIRHMIVTTQ